jgi:hypothetical protein
LTDEAHPRAAPTSSALIAAARSRRLLISELSVACGTPALDVFKEPGGVAVGESSDQLLSDSKSHYPAKNLPGGVERAEAGDEVGAHEQQADHRGQGTCVGA